MDKSQLRNKIILNNEKRRFTRFTMLGIELRMPAIDGFNFCLSVSELHDT